MLINTLLSGEIVDPDEIAHYNTYPYHGPTDCKKRNFVL